MIIGCFSYYFTLFGAHKWGHARVQLRKQQTRTSDNQQSHKKMYDDSQSRCCTFVSATQANFLVCVCECKSGEEKLENMKNEPNNMHMPFTPRYF